MLVRLATPTDLPAIAALEQRVETAAHWTREQYQRMFAGDGPQRTAWVVEADGTGERNVIGFAVALCAGQEWEIENVVVAPEWRRRGLGAQLVAELLAAARRQAVQSVFLEVRDSNAAARALYEQHGFLLSGRRKGYYARPEEDAVLYTLRLNG